MALNIEDWTNMVSGDPMMSSSSSQLSAPAGERLLNGNTVETTTADTVPSSGKTIDTLASGPDLFSQETLDRASPELWPEQIPGVIEFVARSQSPLLSTYGSQSHHQQSLPSGRIINTGSTTTIALNEGHNLFGHSSSTPSQGNRHRDGVEWLGIKDQLTQEEMHLIQGFGNLNSVSLYEKVRELQDLAYQLGLEESREMSRGTLLNVLQPSGHSSRWRDNIENIDKSSKRPSCRKQKLSTDKRLFFTDADTNDQSSDQSRPPPTLTEGRSNDEQPCERHQMTTDMVNISMPTLQLIPNLDSDSNPSSPFRSLRSDPSPLR